MSGRAVGKPRHAGDRGSLEAGAGMMRSKHLLAKRGTNKPGYLPRAYSSSRPESRRASLRGEASSARRPRLSSVCQRLRRPTGAPCCLTVVVIAAGGGRGPTPLRRHPRKQGRDSMGRDTTLQNVGEIQARLQNGKVHKPNDDIL